MIVNMLKAISEMLDIKGSDEVLATQARIKCAKIMLDEIIRGLEGNPQQLTHVPTVEIPIVKDTTPKKQEPPEPQYLISADDGKLDMIKVKTESGKLVEILPNQEVELDEVNMTYEQAKGKKFKRAKVL